jgi:O-antigen/teichoic acid export membrane protein
MVYTRGVYDVNYYRPIFALVVCISEFFNIARAPADSLINAAGHFRQTRNGAIIEVIINIVASLIFIQMFGLVGVALGSLCALMFRTVQVTVYASRSIVKRSIWSFIQKVSISALTAGIIVILVQFLPYIGELSYLSWLLYALSVFGIALAVAAVVTVAFYREDAGVFIGVVRDTLAKKRKK